MAQVRCQDNALVASLFEAILVSDFFISDGEMETCTGVKRQEFENILVKIVQAEDCIIFNVREARALHFAITNVCLYPHYKDKQLSELIGIDVSEDSAVDDLERKCERHKIRVVG